MSLYDENKNYITHFKKKEIDAVVKLIDAQQGRIEKQAFGGAPDSWIDLGIIKQKLRQLPVVESGK